MENIQYIKREDLEEYDREDRLRSLLLLERLKDNKSINKETKELLKEKLIERIEKINTRIFSLDIKKIKI